MQLPIKQEPPKEQPKQMPVEAEGKKRKMPGRMGTKMVEVEK